MSWQTATVYRNYGGNWTALFCAGDTWTLPDGPGFDGLYRFPNSSGFDGQFYYVMAHDPFLRRGLASYIDYPGLRYRRILLPLAAYVLALGRAPYIAAAYIFVVWCFLFAGAWWLSLYAAERGRSPAWGLLLLAMPATLISLDRLTTDLVLLALTIGALYYWEIGARHRFFCVLALACLARETGVLVVAGFCLSFWVHGRRRDALLAALCVLPFFTWSAYIGAHFPPRFELWYPSTPFASTLRFLFHPPPYPWPTMTSSVVRAFDLVALAGIAAAFWLMARLRKWSASPLEAIGLLFVCLGIYLFSLDDWTHVYDFGRVLSPLLTVLALHGIVYRRRVELIPVLLVFSRVCVQMAPQLIGIFR